LRFPGQLHDPETGLHYNNQRYYDPLTGRYLNPDPLGLAPGPDPHAYVTNPTTWTDPLGLNPCQGSPPGSDAGGNLSASDLSGPTLSNYNRFLKSLPSAAEDPAIVRLPNGDIRFDANVPAANIPGSYATYTKVVDSRGNTITFYKTTYAPDGSVVHVKVKYP
jgi:RHS repeat-associated protein